MNNQSLSNPALSVIDQYLNFKVGNAICAVPYFNNKTKMARASLRALIGKGSPADIFDEIHGLMLRSRVKAEDLTSEVLKKTLTDNNIGIECSGFAYYVLDAESRERTKSGLDKNIKFINCKGLLGKVRCSMRPVENCDVATFASDANSHVVDTKDARAGDIITMTAGPEGAIRDHILVIHQVDILNGAPTEIHYSHSIAYPEDGIYGTGARQGKIEISNPDAPITEANWIEGDKQGDSNLLLQRAKKSTTNIRRLNWF